MHTMTIKLGDTTYYIHHNGDWSGEAKVRNNKDGSEILIPAELFIKASREAAFQYVRGQVLGAVEVIENDPKWKP